MLMSDFNENLNTDEEIHRAFNTEEQEAEGYSEADHETEQPQSIRPSLTDNKRSKLWFSLFLALIGILISIFVVPAVIRYFSADLRLDSKKPAAVTTTAEPEKQESAPIFDNFDRPELNKPALQDENKENSEDQEDTDSKTESNNKQLFLQNISLLKSSAASAGSSSEGSSASSDEDDKAAAERDNAAIEKKGDEMIARLTRANQEEHNIQAPSSKNTISQNRYDTEQYARASATKLHLDPDLSLHQGTFIPCILQTKIVSTIAGEVTCVLSDDVYSHSGNVVLLEKGSKVFGIFNSDQLQDGENRIFIIWQKIRTPNDVEINIASNATDELGGSGVEGWVDNHFFRRFGAAIMVSAIAKFVTTASENAANRVITPAQKQVIKQKNNSPVDAQVTSIANSILQKEMNIQPTLYRNQGDVVGIMLARDLDFSQVYSLRLKYGR